MKTDRLMNPNLCAAVAALGHTEYLAIVDVGLPTLKNTNVIDISLSKGIPSFIDVLNVIMEELVVEEYIYAEEIESANQNVFDEMQVPLKNIPCRKMPHEEFKKTMKDVKIIIRTGESSSFANVILVGGVNF